MCATLALSDTLALHRIDTVVHLASIVTPGKDSNRAFEHSVDVGGTHNVLTACVAQGVQHLVVSSSGAAYGYHADNPAWLTEARSAARQPGLRLRGPQTSGGGNACWFRASKHRVCDRPCCASAPSWAKHVDNQITALFEKPRLIAIRGSDSPFVFIWDEDVTGAMLHALSGQGVPGCYNLAGDGALTIHEIAAPPGQAHPQLPGGPAAGRAVAGVAFGREPLWARATRFFALPPGVAQHGAEGRVWLHRRSRPAPRRLRLLWPRARRRAAR